MAPKKTKVSFGHKNAAKNHIHGPNGLIYVTNRRFPVSKNVRGYVPSKKKHHWYHAWEPTTFIFRGYNPYVYWGFKTFIFYGFGVQSSASTDRTTSITAAAVGTSSTDLRRSPAAPACNRAAVEPEKLARRGPAEVLLGAIVATAEPLVLGPFALKLKCLEVPPGAEKKLPKTIFEGGDVTSKSGIKLRHLLYDHHFMLCVFPKKTTLASLEYLFSLVG